MCLIMPSWWETRPDKLDGCVSAAKSSQKISNARPVKKDIPYPKRACGSREEVFIDEGAICRFTVTIPGHHD
jgi:hypothetical protein